MNKAALALLQCSRDELLKVNPPVPFQCAACGYKKPASEYAGTLLDCQGVFLPFCRECNSLPYRPIRSPLD